MSDGAFKQAIEQVKLRLPIEDVVREHVSALKRQGALWVACCPFHEERTPSFKVDPRRGTWRCYGACGVGGDVIAFVERAQGVEFRTALEILAGRAGVELPDPQGERRREWEQRHLAQFDALARAERYFQRLLFEPAGRAALDYVRGRGLEEATLRAFGLGFAPDSLHQEPRPGGPARPAALWQRAQQSGVALEVLEAVGLVRRNARGPYDFFRGRLMFPVRDVLGRTVGFGARRLTEDPAQPKYVNTPETELFKKGRLIYGLDRAMAAARRERHLILVEGYTDVMAAHQVGLEQVVAVLGTATTDDHAALVRRTGARRVSLVFDGDAAGRKATFQALRGLLPLDVALDVVRLAGEADPCDFLLSPAGGKAAFQAQLEQAMGWFDFLFEGWEALGRDRRLAAMDAALELIGRLEKPLARESRLQELAERAGMPLEGVRAQFESLPERARLSARHANERAPADVPSAPAKQDAALALREQAWRELLAAVLARAELFERARPFLEECSHGDLAHLFEALRRLRQRLGGGSWSARELYDELGEHPARGLVVPLLDLAQRAESPQDLLEGALSFLARQAQKEHVRELMAVLSQESDSAAQAQALAQLHRSLGSLAGPAPAADGERPPVAGASSDPAPAAVLPEEDRQLTPAGPPPGSSIHRLPFGPPKAPVPSGAPMVPGAPGAPMAPERTEIA